MKNIKKIISDWRTVLVLLGLYAVVLAGATFIEARHGTPFVKKAVYNSWWFFLLHIVLVVNFIFVSLRHKLMKRKKWGVLTAHYGFVVILVGALITHVWGYEGIMHVREGESSDFIVMADNSVKDVPFSVELEKFNLVRYKWSNTPSSYESDVIIRYKGKTERNKIFMNNIARVAGFRIYQTSYDADEHGTVLTVNSDRWGSFISYAGYFLLFAGLVISMFAKGSRFRTLYSGLGKNTGTAMLVLLAVFLPVSLEAQPSTVVNKEHARKFSEILVQSPSGRIEPVNTYSSEILRKIYHKDSYKGLNSDQVLAGMITMPHVWSAEPVIYISSNEVADGMGVSGSYVSFEEMFDEEDNYRIGSLVDDISRRPPAERSKIDKEYLKLDEKINILYALFSGDMFPVFAVGDGPWLSSVDAVSVEDIDPKDMLVVSRTMLWYGEAVNQGNYAEADKVVGLIKKYQEAKAGTGEINPKKVKAEMFYNKADIFRWSFRLYLVLGFVLTVAVLLKRMPFRDAVCRLLAILIASVFILHTFGIGLRWYVSGHAPWSNAYESMIYVGWTTVLAGLLFARRSRLALGLAALLGGVILFVSNLNWLDPQITPLVPVLKSYWLMIHVSVITASYGFFGVCAACGIASLIGFISGHNFKELRAINEMSMNIGLVLLTVGVFLGAIWANESWGRYWGWDPKETWALITMVVYAFVTHSRFVPKLNNPFAFDVMSVIAIASVLMTFFGVNYYLSGLHSYGGSGEVSFNLVFITAGILAALFIASGLKYKRLIPDK